MKFVVLSLVVAASLFQSAHAQTVQVMSWNIRYNNPADGLNAWPHRKDWVAKIISENNIDLAGFQEVLVDQYEDLKQRLPDMEAYGVGRDDGKVSGEFSPVFFRRDRFELLGKSTFWLSPTPDVPGSKGWDAALPRIASWVKLKDRETKRVIVVINTHFDHMGVKARNESAALIHRQIRTQFPDSSVILTGDFNTTPETPAYKTLTAKDEKSKARVYDTFSASSVAPEGPNSTWNGFKEIVPGQRIDFIFATESLNALHVRILTDQREGRFPSDHLPVTAELQWVQP